MEGRATVGPEMVAVSVEAERAVAIAWRRVLGEDPVPGMSFLEAAGDSLQLLTFVFALESRVGRRLDLAGFTAETDAAGMGRALDAALAGGSESGGAPAGGVFLLPGARGDTPGLAGLRTDCVGRTQMEMMTYPDWRGIVRGRMRMEDVAAGLLPAVSAAAEREAVTLIGYSMGAQLAGMLAFALEAAGLAVRRLVIIDMPTPRWHGGVSHVWFPPRSPREAWWEIGRLRRQGAGSERLGLILARVLGSPALRAGLRRMADSGMPARVGRAFGNVGYWTGHHLGQELRFIEGDAWARRWHRPGQKPGQVLRAPVWLVRTTAHRAEAPEDLGWREVAERVTVVRVPGDHVSMLSAGNRQAVSAAVLAALDS